MSNKENRKILLTNVDETVNFNFYKKKFQFQTSRQDLAEVYFVCYVFSRIQIK